LLSTLTLAGWNQKGSITTTLRGCEVVTSLITTVSRVTYVLSDDVTLGVM
jgi:hypothetical protein